MLQAPRATVISGPEIAPAPTAAPLHVPDAACFVTVTAKPAEPQSFIARTMIEGISLAGYFTPQAGQPVREPTLPRQQYIALRSFTALILLS